MWLQAWDQILIADNGIQSISGLQSDNLLGAAQGERLEQEIHHLNESRLIFLEQHVSIVSQQQTHASFHKYIPDFTPVPKEPINVQSEYLLKYGN
jgi:hypothetical protein